MQSSINAKSSGLFKNFSLVHQNGTCAFYRNYFGEKLDNNFSLVFASSLRNFSKSFLGESVRDVSSENNRVYIKEIGQFVMMLQCSFRISQSLAQIILKDLHDILELLFGTAEHWDSDNQIFDISGAQDLVSLYFSKQYLDPFILTGGICRSFVSPEIIERLDKLLGSLEIQQHICGNGTMITCGASVIHSRLSLKETRKIAQFLKARPLGSASIRYTPVYVTDRWHALYSIRVQSFVLSVLCYMEVPFLAIQPQVSLFESNLIQSKMEIPSEETPVLLRFFAKRETLALLYHNTMTNTTIFPSLRTTSEHQQKEILDEFWFFYGDAFVALNANRVSEHSGVRGAYKFYCRSQGVHRIYMLLANEAFSSDASALCTDVLRSIHQFIQQ